MLGHMTKYGISSITTPGPTLTRGMPRKDLPNDQGQGFSLGSRMDEASLSYVDLFLVERTEDGWKPTIELPSGGLSRQEVAGKFGVWQDQSVTHRTIPLVGETVIDEMPDGKVQNHEVRVLEYGAEGAVIGGSLLGAEILENNEPGTFSIRAAAQPSADKWWERALNLAESSRSHHEKLLNNDDYWMIRD